MKKLMMALLAGTMMQAATPALADDMSNDLFDFGDASRWMVRARAIQVQPDESSTVTGLATKVKAGNAVTPEVDVTYFFTPNVAAELIAATSNHKMSTKNGVDLGDTWILPPTLTLQYHFNPKGEIRPYVGAGLGYIMYYGEDKGATNSIKYKDGIAYALQAGVDVPVDDNWAVNLDVKKLYHNTDVTINGGAITADVDLDPWIFGAGIGYHF